MKLELSGKTAFISGASRGIGKAIAFSLVEEGASVIICSRNNEKLKQTEHELSKKGKVTSVSADLSDEEAVKYLSQRVKKIHPEIDFLIHSAGGIERYGSFTDLEIADWVSSFRMNVMTTVNIVKYFLPFLSHSQSPRIIIISSLAAVQPGSYNPHYSSAKAAVNNLSKHLANTLAKEKILVNTISAGPVHSDLWDRNIDHIALKKGISKTRAMAELELQEKKKVPLGRIGDPTDIAGLVTFLCSEKASWITGSNIHIDGGKIAIIS